MGQLRTGNGGTNAYVHGVIIRKSWDLKRQVAGGSQARNYCVEVALRRLVSRSHVSGMDH